MSKATYYHIAGGELVEGTALGRITVVLGANFDTLAEAYVRAGEREHALRVELHAAKQKNDALQERLNVADQKDDDLSFQLNDREASRYDWLEAAQAAEKRVEMLEARLAERAELSAKNQQLSGFLRQALAALNPRGELAKAIKVALEKATERSPCKACHGEGVIHTGIDESPTTICHRCEGLGHE